MFQKEIMKNSSFIFTHVKSKESLYKLVALLQINGEQKGEKRKENGLENTAMWKAII